MRGFLSVLLFVMVPSWLFAQGGVTTTDDYDAGARSPELFQPGEEAEALLLMPLQAYPSAFSSLSDFNFSFVRYNRRGYDSRYSMPVSYTHLGSVARLDRIVRVPGGEPARQRIAQALYLPVTQDSAAACGGYPHDDCAGYGDGHCGEPLSGRLVQRYDPFAAIRVRYDGCPELWTCLLYTSRCV